ncbi:hypothetical protein N9C39_03805 [Luminiphilus sp.]|nr:hypothetical protein [Luminiphilus sp.]
MGLINRVVLCDEVQTVANDLDALGISSPSMDDFTAVGRKRGVHPTVRAR